MFFIKKSEKGVDSDKLACIIHLTLNSFCSLKSNSNTICVSAVN